MDYKDLANLIFPEAKPVSYYEEKYPERNLPEGAMVTRFAPSPTGFVHLGSLYQVVIAKKVAKQTNGVFFLRVEDTDQKREVENGVTGIIKSLEDFGLTPDEGMVNEIEEIGEYGPYKQSLRKDIYEAYAKYLLEQGKAYPCFASAEELDEMRKKQEASKMRTGYYDKFAKCRKLSLEDQYNNIKNGMPYVIRFKSLGNYDDKFVFLREVIQNALDACKIQLWRDILENRYKAWISQDDVNKIQPFDIEHKVFENYVVKVMLRNYNDTHFEIVIKDNGTGLSAEQFTQIVMIAQGDFLKLLYMKSDERKRIFSKLFQTDKYWKIQEQLKYRSMQLDGQMEENKRAYEQEQSRIMFPEELESEEHRSLEELNEKIKERKQTIEKECTQYQEKIKMLSITLSGIEEVNRQFGQFEKLLCQYQELKEKATDLKAEQSKANATAEAEKLKNSNNGVQNAKDLVQEQVTKDVTAAHNAKIEKFQDLTDTEKAELKIALEADIKATLDNVANSYATITTNTDTTIERIQDNAKLEETLQIAEENPSKQVKVGSLTTEERDNANRAIRSWGEKDNATAKKALHDDLSSSISADQVIETVLGTMDIPEMSEEQKDNLRASIIAANPSVFNSEGDVYENADISKLDFPSENAIKEKFLNQKIGNKGGVKTPEPLSEETIRRNVENAANLFGLNKNNPVVQSAMDADIKANEKSTDITKLTFENLKLLADSKSATNVEQIPTDQPPTAETPEDKKAEAKKIGKHIRKSTSGFKNNVPIELAEYVTSNIKAHNIVEVWDNYEAAQKEANISALDRDSSILSTFTSEVLSTGENSERQATWAATEYIINQLTTRAEAYETFVDVHVALVNLNEAKDAFKSEKWIEGAGRDYEVSTRFEGPIDNLVEAIKNAEAGKGKKISSFPTKDEQTQTVFFTESNCNYTATIKVQGQDKKISTFVNNVFDDSEKKEAIKNFKQEAKKLGFTDPDKLKFQHVY